MTRSPSLGPLRFFFGVSRVGLVLLTFTSSHFVFAQARNPAVGAEDPLPTCLKGKSSIPMDNDAVLILKKTTKNQTLARAFVSGVVTDTYANKSSHDHFEIMIGKDKTEVLEVVYNNEFGDLPPIRLGMRVEACGDYITSNAKTAQYPASPAGAIIHWVHDNPKSGHEDGFLRIDGTIYGNSYKQAKPSKPAAPPKRAKKPGKPKEVFAEMTALY